MLREHVTRYVELHRCMGFKFRTQSLLLNNFIAFAESQGDEFINTSQAVKWAGQAPSVSGGVKPLDSG